MDALLLILLSISGFQTTFISATQVPSEISTREITNFIGNALPDCKMNIIFLDNVWGTHFEDQLLSELTLSDKSEGITILRLIQNQTNLPKRHRPIPFVSSHCSISLTMITSFLTQSIDSVLTELMTTPILSPFTFKNMDKYIFLTIGTQALPSLESSLYVTKLKYKLAISIPEEINENIKGHSFCPHCPQGRIQTFELNGFKDGDPVEFFPDFQKNYYGARHRVAATTKLSSLMVFKKNEVDGRYYATGGSHASMLFHFRDKLNFTYEIIPAYKGNTGIQLPNGTWVGSIGSILYGDADWSNSQAVDYNRNQFVESCSGVSTENWGFIVGPPQPVYTWKAIFWPFTLGMWLCIFATTFVSSIFGHFFIRYGHNMTDHLGGSDGRDHGNYVNVAQFLTKALIGQGEDIAVSIPQPVKIFYGYWLLFALVTVTAYTSKLMTFMTFPVVAPIPDDFQQLIHSDYGIATQYFGSVIDGVLKTSKDPTFMTVVKKMEAEPDGLTCIAKTVKSKYVCLIYEVVWNDLKYRNVSNKEGYTPITMPQGSFAFSFEVGVAHQKKAALSRNFRWIILWAKDMGLLLRWQIQHFSSLLKAKNNWERETGTKQEFVPEVESSGGLEIVHLIGGFTVLFSGTFTGALILAFEVSKAYYQKRKMEKKSKLIFGDLNHPNIKIILNRSL